MKEEIYAIPINDALRGEGCPFCRIEQSLTENSLEYIMGAAMMEPDVRGAANLYGFCAEHYSDMLRIKNRLSLALMDDSRLKTLDADIFSEFAGGRPNLKKLSAALDKYTGSCFVCGYVEKNMTRMMKNAVHMWRSDAEFRQALDSCDPICLPHFSMLLKTAIASLPKKEAEAMCGALIPSEKRAFDSAAKDVDVFCRSFDYRNAGTDLGDAKYAVENAGKLLCGERCARKQSGG